MSLVLVQHMCGISATFANFEDSDLSSEVHFTHCENSISRPGGAWKKRISWFSAWIPKSKNCATRLNFELENSCNMKTYSQHLNMYSETLRKSASIVCFVFELGAVQKLESEVEKAWKRCKRVQIL